MNLFHYLENNFYEKDVKFQIQLTGGVMWKKNSEQGQPLALSLCVEAVLILLRLIKKMRNINYC